MNEDARPRGFYVVLTKENERYLVDTYSAATAAVIVESQFGEEVDSVHTTTFKKIILMGVDQNGTNDQTAHLQATDRSEASDGTTGESSSQAEAND